MNEFSGTYKIAELIQEKIETLDIQKSFKETEMVKDFLFL